MNLQLSICTEIFRHCRDGKLASFRNYSYWGCISASPGGLKVMNIMRKGDKSLDQLHRIVKNNAMMSKGVGNGGKC